MREVQHRRHSLRRPGDLHLSDEGRALARRLRPVVGAFDLVVTSSAARAVETAEALGCPPTRTVEQLREIPDEVARSLARSNATDFVTLFELARTSAAVGEYARTQADLWRGWAEEVPDGGRVLIVSHSGVIELGAVAAVGAGVRSWGTALAPLEGVTLTLDLGGWIKGAPLRSVRERASRPEESDGRLVG